MQARQPGVTPSQGPRTRLRPVSWLARLRRIREGLHEGSHAIRAEKGLQPVRRVGYLPCMYLACAQRIARGSGGERRCLQGSGGVISGGADPLVVYGWILSRTSWCMKCTRERGLQVGGRVGEGGCGARCGSRYMREAGWEEEGCGSKRAQVALGTSPEGPSSRGAACCSQPMRCSKPLACMRDAGRPQKRGVSPGVEWAANGGRNSVSKRAGGDGYREH
jgi:hypothetical protein